MLYLFWRCEWALLAWGTWGSVCGITFIVTWFLIPIRFDLTRIHRIQADDTAEEIFFPTLIPKKKLGIY